MTTDEIVGRLLDDGSITVDFGTGKVYGHRGRGAPRELGSLNHDGYVQFGLSAEGRRRYVYAHRVVYMAAYGPIPEGMVIDHINNDRADNRLANLQLMTVSGNHMKAWHDGRFPWVKTSEEDREEIAREYGKGGCTMSQLAERYGISRSRIWEIVDEHRRSQGKGHGLGDVEWLDGDDVA